MTANEIKKALEICSKAKNYDDCKKLQCPLYRECKIEHKSMEDTIIPYALDLINQYEAEIKKNENIIRLADKAIETANAENKRLSVLAKLGNMRANDYRTMRDKCNTIKAEAIKEFAERLKEVSHPYADTQMVFEIQIDNLLKEMDGENNV